MKHSSNSVFGTACNVLIVLVSTVSLSSNRCPLSGILNFGSSNNSKGLWHWVRLQMTAKSFIWMRCSIIVAKKPVSAWPKSRTFFSYCTTEPLQNFNKLIFFDDYWNWEKNYLDIAWVDCCLVSRHNHKRIIGNQIFKHIFVSVISSELSWAISKWKYWCSEESNFGTNFVHTLIFPKSRLKFSKQ